MMEEWNSGKLLKREERRQKTVDRIQEWKKNTRRTNERHERKWSHAEPAKPRRKTKKK